MILLKGFPVKYKDKIYGTRWHEKVYGQHISKWHIDFRGTRVILCNCFGIIHLGNYYILPGKVIKSITRSKYKIRY